MRKTAASREKIFAERESTIVQTPSIQLEEKRRRTKDGQRFLRDCDTFYTGLMKGCFSKQGGELHGCHSVDGPLPNRYPSPRILWGSLA